MNKTAKAAYLMSVISAIMNALILLSMLMITIYVFIEAPKDSEGGGWALFIVLLFGFALIPYLLMSIAHCILTLISFLKRKKRIKTSKGCGIAGSVCALVTNGAVWAYLSLAVIAEPTSIASWITSFGAMLFAVYQLVTLILFIKMKVQN